MKFADSGIKFISHPSTGFNMTIVNHLSLHLVLATESAQVFAVLRDFHLLDSLPQTGTISGSVLSGDSDLLCSLGHCKGFNFFWKKHNLAFKSTITLLKIDISNLLSASSEIEDGDTTLILHLTIHSCNQLTIQKQFVCQRNHWNHSIHILFVACRGSKTFSTEIISSLLILSPAHPCGCCTHSCGLTRKQYFETSAYAP